MDFERSPILRNIMTDEEYQKERRNLWMTVAAQHASFSYNPNDMRNLADAAVAAYDSRFKSQVVKSDTKYKGPC